MQPFEDVFISSNSDRVDRECFALLSPSSLFFSSFASARKSSHLFSENLPCSSRALLRKSSVKTLVVSLLVVGPHLFEKWAHCFQMDYSSFISPLCFPLSLSKVIASPPVSQTRLGLLCAKCTAPFRRAWVLLSAQWTRLVGSSHS